MASSSSTCHSNYKVASTSTAQLLHPSMASTSIPSGGFSQSTQIKTPTGQAMASSSMASSVATSACPIIHLNKRGNPIYSREDIREQYCINSKELQVFEAGLTGHSSRLFGCLSMSHLPDHGPCSSSRSEHLFSLSSCVKRKASLDSIKRVSR